MLNYKVLKDNNIVCNTIKKIKSAYFVSNKNNSYFIKESKEDLSSKFKYLSARGFSYFPKHSKIDKYDVFEYIEDANISKEERFESIMEVLSVLHYKTTRYSDISLDDYKKIYEDISNLLNSALEYYSNLNDSIDNEIYMSPSHYLLVLNISIIYNVIRYCNLELDNWYEKVKENDKERFSFIHNNLDLDHLLYNKKPYLISWEKSKIDFPIYDLVDLYKKYYKSIDFKDLFNIYLNKYPLKDEELKLFFILVSIPDIIKFNSDEFNNIKKVKSLLEKINTSDKLIRSFYQKKETKNT